MFENNINLPPSPYSTHEQSHQLLDRQYLEQVAQNLVDCDAVISPRGRGFDARQAPDESQTISVALNLGEAGSNDITIFRLGLYDQQPEPETPSTPALGRHRSIMVWEMVPLETRHNGLVHIAKLRGLVGLPPDEPPYGVRYYKGGVELSAVPTNHPAVQPLTQIIEKADSDYRRQPKPETARSTSAVIPRAIGRTMLLSQFAAS